MHFSETTIIRFCWGTAKLHRSTLARYSSPTKFEWDYHSRIQTAIAMTPSSLYKWHQFLIQSSEHTTRLRENTPRQEHNYKKSNSMDEPIPSIFPQGPSNKWPFPNWSHLNSTCRENLRWESVPPSGAHLGPPFKSLEPWGDPL